MPKGRTAKENSQAGVTSFIDFKEMPKLALAKSVRQMSYTYLDRRL